MTLDEILRKGNWPGDGGAASRHLGGALVIDLTQPIREHFSDCVHRSLALHLHRLRTHSLQPPRTCPGANRPSRHDNT
jgi:hypothetical protein